MKGHFVLTVNMALSGLDDTHEDPQLERGKGLKKHSKLWTLSKPLGMGEV